MIKENAIIICDGMLNSPYGKTAHGLIKKSERFNILAVIDDKQAGKDAGIFIDKISLNIPVYANVKEAIEKLSDKPSYCIIGVATIGGKLTKSLIKDLSVAIEHGINIVNGLHEPVSEDAQLKPLINKYRVTAIDLRKPKPFNQMYSWSGDILKINTPRIAVLGTDCCIGKRTTCQLLLDNCKEHNIKTEMIYTGQTGWLQGLRYGFVLDATLNDFVSGELEKSIIDCVTEVAPELILIEGQSALRNPSGPCGSEIICSAGAKGVILQHVLNRKYFNHGNNIKYPLPELTEEIKMIELYGAEVLAITLNLSDTNNSNIEDECKKIYDTTGIPVIIAKENIHHATKIIQKFIKNYSGRK